MCTYIRFYNYFYIYVCVCVCAPELSIVDSALFYWKRQYQVSVLLSQYKWLFVVTEGGKTGYILN